MATIIVRNLDDEVAERLKLQARLRGTSLEQEARRLLTEGTKLSRKEIAVEATNAWWKRLRRREMDVAEVERAVTHLLAMQIVWVAAATLLRPAVRLAAKLGHPMYDCVYLALAVSRSAVLATADERLRTGADRVGVRLWSARR